MSDEPRGPATLGRLFNPRSIAVVGASRKREKIGNVVFRNLAGTFREKLYAVNSAGEQVEGRKAYGGLSLIEDEVEDMLRESRVYAMLNARKRSYDQSALVGTITRLSRMTVDLRIAEADLNPVIVNADGAFAVDVRVLLSEA